MAADYQRIRITEPLILGVIQAGPFTEGNFSQKVSQKSKSFSRPGSLKDTGTTKAKKIHEDFLQLLQKTPTGYYETKLPWKLHIPLPKNKTYR